MKNFKNSIKEYLKGLSKKMIITIILTLSIAGYLAVKAAFVEPGSAPSSSDQDFTENVMGANNADNDFSSSSVASNRDGSVIERLEYIFTGSTCGNSVVEVGENCDDGGTSWTSGTCAGDCSRRNYWSSPSYASDAIGAGTLLVSENANVYCQEKGFRIYTSYATNTGSGKANYYLMFNSSTTTPTSTVSQSSLVSTFSTFSESMQTGFSRSYYYHSVSFYSYYYSSLVTIGWTRDWSPEFSLSATSSSTSSSLASATAYVYTTLTKYYITSFTYQYYASYYSYSSVFQPSTSIVISEIWCAD